MKTLRKIRLGLLLVLVAGVAILLALLYTSRERLRAENEILRRQNWELNQVGVENDRLSNLLAQALAQLARATNTAAGAPAAPAAAEAMTAYFAARGSKVRIEGTANRFHPVWLVESDLIGGLLEVGPGFPTEPGQAATPGKVAARAPNVFIQARSLRSVEKDGRPYSDVMDGVMYEYLKAGSNPAIRFRLTGLALKEAPKAKDAPYAFDAKGELAVAGVTNAIAFPIAVLPLEGKKLKITGSAALKMSDYQAGPVKKEIVGVHLETGDDIMVTFEWMVAQRASGAASPK
jgi:hypothetical protein